MKMSLCGGTENIKCVLEAHRSDNGTTSNIHLPHQLSTFAHVAGLVDPSLASSATSQTHITSVEATHQLL